MLPSSRKGRHGAAEALSGEGAHVPAFPSRTAPMNQTIRLSNGRVINCTTLGVMTNCM